MTLTCLIENIRDGKVMTPEEFSRKMQAVSEMDDIEDRHIAADGLICDMLRSFGYDQGIDIFEDFRKYYA